MIIEARINAESLRDAFQFALDTWGIEFVEHYRNNLLEFATMVMNAPSVSDEQPKAEDPKGLSPQGASAVGKAETPSLSSLPVGEE